VVPPSSVVPFLDVLPDHKWTLLHYEGDTGVALRMSARWSAATRITIYGLRFSIG
jgi:hypothetical protein